MWADEFNGVCHHLQSRSAFVVVSPDSPSGQQDFREEARMAVPDVLCGGHDVLSGIWASSGMRKSFCRDTSRASRSSAGWEGRYDSAGIERLVRPGRSVLRRVAPVRSAVGWAGRLGSAVRLPLLRRLRQVFGPGRRNTPRAAQAGTKLVVDEIASCARHFESACNRVGCPNRRERAATAPTEFKL